MPHIRQTITALRGIEKHTAALDARSAVALEFATFWARRHTGLRPAPAVVIRRALQLLAEHLSALPEVDPEGRSLARECRAFLEAGAGHGSARSLTEARARIEDHLEAPARQPMAHWKDALFSQAERAEQRRIVAAANRHLENTE